MMRRTGIIRMGLGVFALATAAACLPDPWRDTPAHRAERHAEPDIFAPVDNPPVAVEPADATHPDIWI